MLVCSIYRTPDTDGTTDWGKLLVGVIITEKEKIAPDWMPDRRLFAYRAEDVRLSDTGKVQVRRNHALAQLSPNKQSYSLLGRKGRHYSVEEKSLGRKYIKHDGKYVGRLIPEQIVPVMGFDGYTATNLQNVAVCHAVTWHFHMDFTAVAAALFYERLTRSK